MTSARAPGGEGAGAYYPRMRLGASRAWIGPRMGREGIVKISLTGRVAPRRRLGSLALRLEDGLADDAPLLCGCEDGTCRACDC